MRNLSPTKTLDNCTPYEVRYYRKPSVRHLQIFGSVAIALDKTHNHKFRPKGREYIMVVYSDRSKAYHLFEKTMGKVTISRDIHFIDDGGEKLNKPVEHAILLR